MAKKRSVSTSRADREDDKRKRAAAKKKDNNALEKAVGFVGKIAKDAVIAGTKDFLTVAGGGVAAKGAVGAAKAIGGRVARGGNLYRANQARNLKAMTPIQKGMSKGDILRANRKAAVDLARAQKIQGKTVTKGAKGSGWGSGLKKDDISVRIQPARRGQGMSSSRYKRLIDGGR